MRIASVSKAFSGAIALQLVQQGRLGLDDTIGARLPGMPAAWAGVTIRQLLNHTSGVPDYTRSKAFVDQLTHDPRGFVTPARSSTGCAADALVFPSGSRYEYSNTDNIVVGLIAEQVTGEALRRPAARGVVFGPAGLSRDHVPDAAHLAAAAVHPRLRHGAGPGAGGRHDVPEPERRVGVGGDRLDAARPRRVHPRPTSRGGSSARRSGASRCGSSAGRRARPGPGRTPPGWRSSATGPAAGPSTATPGTSPATSSGPPRAADGKRSVTTSLNIPAPEGKLLRQLRSVQATAVCALLRG